MSHTCPNCGSPNKESHKFCSVCGAQLTPPDSTRSAFVVQSWDDPGSAPGSEGATLPLPPPSGSRPYVPPPPTAAPTYGGRGSAPGVSGRGLSPVEGEQRGEATYAPYAPGAVKHIEKERPARTWLVPAVIIGGVLLMALGATAVYLFLSPGNPVVTTAPPPGSARLPSPSVPVAAECKLAAQPSPEEEVQNVVCRSNQEQIRAWRELDTSILAGTRTGGFLEENISVVEEMKRHKIYGVPVNEQLDVLGTEVKGDRATVRTYEVWTVTFYRIEDNKMVQRRGPDKYFETYHMVKQGDKWMVEKVDFVQPTPGPGD